MIIGGFIAGFISRDRFPGMIAGFITGLFVFAGIVLFFWLILRVKLLDWYAANSSNIGPTINDFLNYFGIDSLSNLGTYLTNVITDKYTEYSSNMDTLVQEYVPKFSLIIGAIFGGIAIIVDTIAGRIGGRLNKIDEILGEDD
ncbi:MAG: hypothetical protein FK734_19565 [Asgard group archaeon]|nr:hypothetical protein [Asgard group archaeon]